MSDSSTSKLLGPGRDGSLNACLNYGVDNWVAYAAGYRKAAEILTEFVRTERRFQDWLIFPVIFLWRHHLELKLKALARSASDLLDRRWKPSDQHDLGQLFGEARVLLEEAFKWAGEKHSPAEMERLRNALRDFRSVDPGSFVFRYPEDLEGGPVLEGVRYINYDNVSEYFTQIANLLESADVALSVFHDWRNEMNAGY